MMTLKLDSRFILEAFPFIRLRGEEESDQSNMGIDLVIRKEMEKLASELRLDCQAMDRREAKLLKSEYRTYLCLNLSIQSIYELTVIVPGPKVC